MHLCTLLGEGKAFLPESGVAKDLALEDLHVWGEACSSGRVWIEGEMSQFGCLVGGSFGGRCGSELDCLDGDIGAADAECGACGA